MEHQALEPAGYLLGDPADHGTAEAVTHEDDLPQVALLDKATYGPDVVIVRDPGAACLPPVPGVRGRIDGVAEFSMMRSAPTPTRRATTRARAQTSHPSSSPTRSEWPNGAGQTRAASHGCNASSRPCGLSSVMLWPQSGMLAQPGPRVRSQHPSTRPWLVSGGSIFCTTTLVSLSARRRFLAPSSSAGVACSILISRRWCLGPISLLPSWSAEAAALSSTLPQWPAFILTRRTRYTERQRLVW